MKMKLNQIKSSVSDCDISSISGCPLNSMAIINNFAIRGIIGDFYHTEVVLRHIMLRSTIGNLQIDWTLSFPFCCVVLIDPGFWSVVWFVAPLFGSLCSFTALVGFFGHLLIITTTLNDTHV